jgi:F-type H+-transporting ATPase subunit gamma
LKTIHLGLIACLHEARHSREPQEKHAVTIGAVVFGSDQGLVGSFNEVIADFSIKALQGLPGKVTRIWAVGERAQSLMVEAGLGSVTKLDVPSSLDGVTPLIGQILLEIEAAREKNEVSQVQVFHNHPKVGSAYEPVGRQLLPLDMAWFDKLAATPWPSKMIPQVIDGAPSALDPFLRGYLFVLLFQACAESLASENASRLASMQRAEKNIDGMLDDLNRKFHRLRQEAIDEELFDVIAGFEALMTKHPSKNR